MGRKRNTDEGGVSLFPFLSILACLIGILTLMIGLMSQLNSPDAAGQTEEDLERAKTRFSLVNQAKQLDKEITRLDQRIQKERASAAGLGKILDQQAALEKQLEEVAAKKVTRPEAIQKSTDTLRQEIARLKSESESLAREAIEIRNTIKNRKQAPEPSASVQIRPGGIGSARPSAVYFVECDAKGIQILRKGGTPERIAVADIPKSQAYRDFLSGIKTVRDPMVLFLIRSTGYDSYRWAANEATTKQGLPIGKLPLPNDGPLDLSLFD